MKSQNKILAALAKWTGLLAIGLLPWISNQAAADGNWLRLGNKAPAAVGNMVLLSDGTVLCANNPDQDSSNIGYVWYRLTPDANGHYVNGTWNAIAPMHDTRRFYSSQIVRDGRLFVAGGEYGSGYGKAEIYDPRTDVWTPVNPPVALLNPTNISPGSSLSFNNGLQGFYDSESMMLPDGNVLIFPVAGNAKGQMLIYNPSANSWTNGPPVPSGNTLDEATWLKLPDGSIMTVIPNSTIALRYIPALTNWVTDAPVPVALYSVTGAETGPAFMLPNGKAFWLGGSGHSAIYSPSGGLGNGTWTPGPDMSNNLVSADTPAAMMPNGKILCALTAAPVGPNTNVSYSTFVSFWEYDYTNGPVGKFTQVNGPTGLTDGVQPYQTSMLVLPDASVLYCNSVEDEVLSSGADLYLYVPLDSSQQTLGKKPVITTITPNSDGSFHLTGYNLNGLSAGAAFGDDVQMNTDFPIIQFQDPNNGHIDYGRTFNWLTGGAYGAGSVDFTLPAGLIPQTYLASISASGVISDPVKFSYISPAFVALCPGESTTLKLITPPDPTLNYQWQLDEKAIPGATNAELNIISAQTNQTGYYDLGWIRGNDTIISPLVPVAVGVWIVNQPPATNSASICQPYSMSVHARGKGTLTAQWFRNSNALVADSRINFASQSGDPGETVFSLSISETKYEDDATYTVLINDDCTQGSTSPFTLRVVPNPPWVRIAMQGPPSRHDAAMCYDSDRKVTVLFGGGTFDSGAAGFLGDTWEFDGTNWTQRLPTNSPVARTQANMVYDSQRHRTVLFGGQHYSAAYGSRFSPETWEWDGANWQQIATPHLPPWTETTYPYASCYDSARGEMLLFGYLQDPLWSYDGIDWKAKNVGGISPSVSIARMMAFDTNRGMAVILGGRASAAGTGNAFNESVWEWDGTAWWERPQSGQEPRLTGSGDGFCYDTFRQECVLFGDESGTVDGQQTTDLYPFPDYLRCIWRWNGKQWQADPPTPTLGVPVESYHSMSFDSARNALVLFGGQGMSQFDVTNYTYEILYQDDPAVLKQPTIQVYLQGQQVQLSVVAAGAPLIGYQWQKGVVNLTDGGPISGSTSNVLTINAANIADSGYYQVVLKNVCGMAVSQPIMLNATLVPGTLAIGASGGNGGNMVIVWSDSSVMLQTATNPAGPWTIVTGASSPYQVSQTAPGQFFRLFYP